MALTDSLISYWELEEASGNALDSHGTSTLTEESTVGTATGKVGNARDFTSGDGFAGNMGTNLGNTGSIAFWVNPDSVNDNQYIIDGSDGNQRACILGYQDGYYNIFNGSYPTGTASDTQMAATGAGSWDFVVWTFDGTTLKGYVNGSLVVNVSASVNATITSITFGHPGGTASSYFAGLLDEVGVWNRVLTGDEVTELYNSGNGRDYAYISGGGGGGGVPIGSLSLLGVGR